MSAHDWDLSDLTDGDLEGMADACQRAANDAGRRGRYEDATDLAIAARIVEGYAEQRDEMGRLRRWVARLEAEKAREFMHGVEPLEVR